MLVFLNAYIIVDEENEEKRKHKYTTRTIKALVDSNTRYLFNRFIELYDYLMNFNKLDMVSQQIEEEMTKLESLGFDDVIKDNNFQYTKNKNSNFKIYISKLGEFYSNRQEELEKLKEDFQEDYNYTFFSL